MQVTSKPVPDIRREELENYKHDLLAEKKVLEEEITQLNDEYEKLRARKDVVSLVLQKHSGSSGSEDFKKNFFDPLKQVCDDKRKTVDEVTEANTNKIYQITAILEFIEAQQNK